MGVEDRLQLLAVVDLEVRQPVGDDRRFPLELEQLAAEIPVFTFQARADTMRRFLAHLSAARGGVAGYLTSIGVAATTAGTLRDLLV